MGSGRWGVRKAPVVQEWTDRWHHLPSQSGPRALASQTFSKWVFTLTFLSSETRFLNSCRKSVKPVLCFFYSLDKCIWHLLCATIPGVRNEAWVRLREWEGLVPFFLPNNEHPCLALALPTERGHLVNTRRLTCSLVPSHKHICSHHAAHPQDADNDTDEMHSLVPDQQEEPGE